MVSRHAVLVNYLDKVLSWLMCHDEMSEIFQQLVSKPKCHVCVDNLLFCALLYDV